MESDPLQDVAARVYRLFEGRREWCQEKIKTYAANPPHYVDEDGFEVGVLPVPFPPTPLTREERIALLAAIADSVGSGLERFNPFDNSEGTAPTFNAYHALVGDRVPELREHWSTEGWKVEQILAEVEQELLGGGSTMEGKRWPPAEKLLAISEAADELRNAIHLGWWTT